MELKVEIDFDEASKYWRMNKKHIGNGYFQYTCKYIHTNGRKCNKPVFSNIIRSPYRLPVSPINPDHPNKDTHCKRHMNRYKF